MWVTRALCALLVLNESRHTLAHSLAKLQINKGADVYEVQEDRASGSIRFINPISSQPTLREIIYYHIIEKPYNTLTGENNYKEIDDSRPFTNAHGYSVAGGDYEEDHNDEKNTKEIEFVGEIPGTSAGSIVTEIPNVDQYDATPKEPIYEPDYTTGHDNNAGEVILEDTLFPGDNHAETVENTSAVPVVEEVTDEIANPDFEYVPDENPDDFEHEGEELVQNPKAVNLEQPGQEENVRSKTPTYVDVVDEEFSPENTESVVSGDSLENGDADAMLPADEGSDQVYPVEDNQKTTYVESPVEDSVVSLPEDEATGDMVVDEIPSERLEVPLESDYGNQEVSDVGSLPLEATLSEEGSVSEVGNMPVEQMPIEVMPTEGVPVYEIPADGTPLYDTPVEETATDLLPTDVIPGEQISIDGMPLDYSPAEGLPVDAMPTDETLVDEIPLDVKPAEADQDETAPYQTEDETPDLLLSEPQPENTFYEPTENRDQPQTPETNPEVSEDKNEQVFEQEPLLAELLTEEGSGPDHELEKRKAYLREKVYGSPVQLRERYERTKAYIPSISADDQEVLIIRRKRDLTDLEAQQMAAFNSGSYGMILNNGQGEVWNDFTNTRHLVGDTEAEYPGVPSQDESDLARANEDYDTEHAVEETEAVDQPAEEVVPFVDSEQPAEETIPSDDKAITSAEETMPSDDTHHAEVVSIDEAPIEELPKVDEATVEEELPKADKETILEELPKPDAVPVDDTLSKANDESMSDDLPVAETPKLKDLEEKAGDDIEEYHGPEPRTYGMVLKGNHGTVWNDLFTNPGVRFEVGDDAASNFGTPPAPTLPPLDFNPLENQYLPTPEPSEAKPEPSETKPELSEAGHELHEAAGELSEAGHDLSETIAEPSEEDHEGDDIMVPGGKSEFEGAEHEQAVETESFASILQQKEFWDWLTQWMNGYTNSMSDYIDKAIEERMSARKLDSPAPEIKAEETPVEEQANIEDAEEHLAEPEEVTETHVFLDEDELTEDNESQLKSRKHKHEDHNSEPEIHADKIFGNAVHNKKVTNIFIFFPEDGDHSKVLEELKPIMNDKDTIHATDLKDPNVSSELGSEEISGIDQRSKEDLEHEEHEPVDEPIAVGETPSEDASIPLEPTDSIANEKSKESEIKEEEANSDHENSDNVNAEEPIAEEHEVEAPIEDHLKNSDRRKPEPESVLSVEESFDKLKTLIEEPVEELPEAKIAKPVDDSEKALDNIEQPIENAEHEKNASDEVKPAKSDSEISTGIEESKSEPEKNAKEDSIPAESNAELTGVKSDDAEESEVKSALEETDIK